MAVHTEWLNIPLYGFATIYLTIALCWCSFQLFTIANNAAMKILVYRKNP